MATKVQLPVGVSLSSDVEYREGSKLPYRARVRWVDPTTKKRPSKSEQFATDDETNAWLDRMKRYAALGVTPDSASMTLADYGNANLELVTRGLERKTLDFTWLDGGSGGADARAHPGHDDDQRRDGSGGT